MADLVGLQKKDHLLKRVFRYLSEVDYGIVSSPELIGEIFALIKDETKNPDPYKESRE